MARGDQFRLFLMTFFFVQGVVAFVIFVLLARLLNYRALKDRPLGWRVAGSIGVVLWTIRNIYVHAWSPTTGVDMAAVSIIAIPAIVLPGLFGFARMMFPPAT